MEQAGTARSFDVYDFRMMCLMVACVLYAVFGSPTPDSIGWVEVVIAVLLLLSVGLGRLRDALFRIDVHAFWKSAGQVLLLYGLCVPVIIGVVAGNGVQVILRDMAPFLFLFLPLFLLPLIEKRVSNFRIILIGVLIIGLLFSLRSFVMRLYGDCPVWCTSELLYLENMPTVLFACLFLIGTAMAAVVRGFGVRSLVVFAVFVALALMPIAAMAYTVQRASIGALVIYMVLIQGCFLYHVPLRGARLLVIGVAAIYVINISFSAMFEELLVKTRVVGLNMRSEEFMAVWDIVTVDIATFLFGIGWGGQFHSPAVGGVSVNFTHNFFSTILLKAGMVGVVLCMAYVAGLLERLGRVIFVHPVLGLAIAAPILIDLTLYASFKSLDFGLMLFMIPCSLVYLSHSESK